MENDGILQKINEYFVLKSKHSKMTDLLSDPSQSLKDELTASMKSMHPLRDRFGLQYCEFIGTIIGFATGSSIAYAIKRSLASGKMLRSQFLPSIVVPCIFGGIGGIFMDKTNERLFKLEQNCKECYRIKTMASTVLFPSVHSFLFASMLCWLHDLTVFNKELKQKPLKMSQLTYGKELIRNYLLKMRTSNVHLKSLLPFVVGLSVAYLYALEQEREFTIVFSKYYEDLIFEEENMKRGLYLDKDASL